MDTKPRENRHFMHSFKTTSTVLTSTTDQSMPTTGITSLLEKVSQAVTKTQGYYVDQQHESGYWWYELESNVTITAEYLMLHRFLGISDSEKCRKMAQHILKRQRPDGTWSLTWGGKGDLSTTVEAYFALKLAGFSADDGPLIRARKFILENGGVEASRVFTKIFLALFGEFDWSSIPSIPIGMNLLPPWFPFNIYSFSSWARSTVVPLSVVLEIKPVVPLPDGQRVTELFKEPLKKPPLTSKRFPLLSWKRFFVVLDWLVKVMQRSPVRPLKNRALKRTEGWIIGHQEPTGDWGGIQPAMINSVVALRALGYDISHGPIQKGLEALERFTIERDDELVLQSCISPVWDTALTGLALLYSGMGEDHPSIENSCRWLASKQIFKKGDWTIKKPAIQAGGWAFEFQNDWYPDVDDTTAVLLLLNRCRRSPFLDPENLQKGLQWVFGMQGKDGGWGAFDVDNNMRILNQLPFGDLEAMIDPSTADLTGRVLELLGLIGYPPASDVVRRAIAFLKSDQKEDGSWWGRWGVNYIYGTSTVLVGLDSIGEDMAQPYIQKAVRWLRIIQKPDGGWGECCESYDDPALKRHGTSTPSQTAWALLALIAAGEGASEQVTRGIRYLLERQQADGTWHEEAFTGTGFPKYFLIRYHNYRNCFPLMALGRFLSTLKKGGTH